MSILHQFRILSFMDSIGFPFIMGMAEYKKQLMHEKSFRGGWYENA